MTITTAKRPDACLQRAPGLPAALKLAPLAIAAMLLSAECHAEWKFTPHVDARETFSDNANNQADEYARSGLISEVTPGFTFLENSARLKVSADGDWHSFATIPKNVSNVQNGYLRYRANAQAMLVDQLLYVDASTAQSRQAISAFGPLASNSYSSANIANISTWSISPYLQHRFGSTANLNVRYTRDSVDDGISGYGSTLASTRAVELVSGPRFDVLSWNVSYNHQDLGSQYAGNSSSENDLAGVRWNLVRTFGLTATAGYDKYDYPTLGERTAGHSWSGGFVWVPSTRTSVQASYGRRYFGKTGSLAASYRTQHSIWTLNYGDNVTTSRSQFLLPAAVDTAGMLDRLLATTYPDPFQRQQAVQAYIAATGLPPTLMSTINYLSNRYLRDKRLQGAFTLRGARSDLVLTVFRDERTALSLSNSDTELLINQINALNDNVRQRGVSAAFDYRLSSRDTATALLSAAHIQSITTGLVTNDRELHLGMTRRFNAKTSAGLELRHIGGRPDLVVNESYHENAIAATLSVLF